MDIIMFLYRDEYYDKDTRNKNTAEIIIAKNDIDKRVELLFNGRYSSFANI